MTAEYTTREATTENRVADTNLYWRVSGWILALVALAGIVAQLIGDGTLIPNFLVVTWTHNVIHIVLAAIALGMGYGGASISAQKNTAIVIGIVYLALGVAGLISNELWGLGTAINLHLELGEDLFHILLGSWGLYAGATGAR